MPARMPEAMPLESGDRLTRNEFHRRYCTRLDIKKAELIQGVVYVSSPVRYTVHDEQNSMVNAWLSFYRLPMPEMNQGGGATIYLSEQDEVQPDAFLFREPSLRPGGLRRTEDGYLEGTPDLVVEIAASTASYDLHDKMEAYRRAGVPEYIVWRTIDEHIDWFVLRGGVYERLLPDERGVISSIVYPGLRLDVAKMLAGDLQGVIAALQTGTEHQS